MKPPHRKLEAMRYYLREWYKWRRNWRPALGFPRAVAWVDEVMGEPSETGESDDGPESWQLHAVDTAIADLAKSKPAMVHALKVRYCREQGLAIWRSGKFPKDLVRILADQAEVELIPMVETRGLLLA